MEVYMDINSDVYRYEIGSDFIRLQFTAGAQYLYTYASAGQSNIEQMKILAQQGSGLDDFIWLTVVELHESRER